MIGGAMAVARAEMMMAVSAPAHLPHKIVKAEKDQRAARDPGKDIAGPPARLDSEPDDEGAENGGKENMAGAAEGHDRERLRLPPALPAAGQHEGQPMGRDGGMGEGDDESGHNDGKKERPGHRC